MLYLLVQCACKVLFYFYRTSDRWDSDVLLLNNAINSKAFLDDATVNEWKSNYFLLLISANMTNKHNIYTAQTCLYTAIEENIIIKMGEDESLFHTYFTSEWKINLSFHRL